MVAFAIYATPVLAPVATHEIGVPAAAIGYFIAVAYVGSMLGSAAAGGWVARFGPIRVSQVGLALCLAGLALAASGWAPLMLLGAFVLGVGYGPTTPASSVILVRTAPPGLYSLIFSLKQTGVPAGGVLAGGLAPALVLAVGWQWAAVAIGASCLVLAALIAPVRARYDVALNPEAPVSVRAAFLPVKLVAGHPQLREMAVTSFAYGGVQITLVTYLVTFLIDSFALSLVLAGAVMAVSQVASVVGRIVWGALADRAVTRRTMLGLLGLGMGVSAMVTLAADPEWPAWVLFAFASVFGATAVGWNGVFLAEVARVAPQGQVSQATGGCLFFTFLGVVLTPLAFNLVLALGGGYGVAYALLGVPGLLIGARLLLRRPA
ncbi:MAG: MFS transporter [Betaproteobacteria bacterium]|nr:MFS transporter [Betaproteobacteria bacterium]